MRIRVWVAVALGVCALLAAGYFLRGHRTESQAAEAMLRQIDKQNATDFRRAALLELPSDVDRIAETIEMYPVVVDPQRGAPPPDVQRELHRTIATILRFMSQVDADGYLDWALSRRYRWTPERPARVEHNYHFVTGEEMQADIRRDDLFRALFEGLLRWPRDFGSPRGIVADSAGGVVVYLNVRSDYERNSAFLDVLTTQMDEPTQLRWWAPTQLGNRRHLDPPISEREVMQRDGAVWLAEVSLASRGAHGAWCVINAHAFYDPAARAWHVLRLSPRSSTMREVCFEH